MKAILKWLDQYIEEFFLVIMLIAMSVVMGIQVFSRFILGASLSWTEELTRYLFIWSGFLSVSYCTKRCISIKIEQFIANFSRRKKAVVKVVNHTIELIFFIYMIPFAYSYMMSAVESGQVSPALGIPMYYVQAAPLVSFILVAFRIIQRWIIEFRVSLGQNVYDPAHPERNRPEAIVDANRTGNAEGMTESGSSGENVRGRKERNKCR
jgi:TRAP-type C4-dicarboxylate transport system permease small subunit